MQGNQQGRRCLARLGAYQPQRRRRFLADGHITVLEGVDMKGHGGHRAAADIDARLKGPLPAEEIAEGNARYEQDRHDHEEDDAHREGTSFSVRYFATRS